MSAFLENWLQRATKYLSAESRDQVRTEIGAHYESACEEARAAGANAQEADWAAVASLGDPASANRAYRKVLLNAWEAQTLWETKRGGIWTGSRLYLCLVAPVLVLISGIRFYSTGDGYFGWALLIGAIGMGIFFIALFLSVHTLVRGRILRIFRCLWVAAVMALSGTHMQGSWLWHLMPIVSAFPLFEQEWRLASLRRKLPVSQWPKQLYL